LAGGRAAVHVHSDAADRYRVARRIVEAYRTLVPAVRRGERWILGTRCALLPGRGPIWIVLPDHGHVARIRATRACGRCGADQGAPRCREPNWYRAGVPHVLRICDGDNKS